MSIRTFLFVSLVLASIAIVPTGAVVYAGTISIAWDPVTHPELAGYRVYYGTGSGSYNQNVDVGTSPEVTLDNLADCTNYYVAVKARGIDGTSESPLFSNEIVGWARPVVGAASPASAERATQIDVTISGANFMSGASVSFSDPAITINGVTVNGCNEIVVNVDIPASTSLGATDVTVVNPDQVFATGVGVLTVTNAAPDGSIDQPTGDVTIDEGDTVQFAGSGSDPDGDTPLSYLWEFGDTTIPDSSQQNPGAVRYDTAGSYQVRMTVTDALGLADTTAAVVTVHVNAAQAPIVSDVNTGSVGSTTATATWTTDRDADSQVLYRPVGDTVDQQTAVDTARVTSHSVDVNGLMPGTEYEYSVRSTDASGLTTTQSSTTTFTTQTNNLTYLRIEAESGAISDPAEVRTGDGAFADAYIRLSPGSATGTANNPTGTWDFGFNVPSPATWYVWFRMYAPNTSSATWYEEVDGDGFAQIAPATSGAWEWVAGRSYGLSSGVHVLTLGGGDAQARIDRVLITDDAGFLPTEAPGGDVTPPSTVSALSALGDDGSVALSWTNPSDSGAMRVVVRYSTGSGHPAHPDDGSPLIDRPATPGAADSVLHTGLTNGTTYRYSVFVVDEWGNASGPSMVAATPQPPVEPLGQVGNLRRTDTLSN